MDWQQIASLAIVLAAAIWLVRTQILAPRKGGCGGCGTCGSDRAAPGPARRGEASGSELIQIDADLARSSVRPAERSPADS